MDEQQLRSAVVAAARARLENLQQQEARLVQQRNEVVVAMEAVTGDLRETQGRIGETLMWIEAVESGEFVVVPEDTAEPEEGD